MNSRIFDWRKTASAPSFLHWPRMPRMTPLAQSLSTLTLAPWRLAGSQALRPTTPGGH
jgi:hypothetical protein